MKRKKWICMLLSVVLLLAGCSDMESGAGNATGLENSATGEIISDNSEVDNRIVAEDDATGANAPEGSGTGGIAADEFYDIELTENEITSPLQEGEVVLGAQYFNGERIWFIGNSEGQIFCYYEEKSERELLENIPEEYQFGYTWYRDETYFYVYSGDVLAVLRSDGGMAYTLRLDGRVEGVCLSREEEIVLVTEGSNGGGSVLKVLDRESGGLSGGVALSEFYGIGEGVEKGIMILDEIGVYDLDMKSGEKTWYMKWSSTSYRPGMLGGIPLTLKMAEDGTLEKLKEVEGGFREESLKKVREYMGKKLLVFRVTYANAGLKLLVTKFNQENQEYHVLLQDRGEESARDFRERNDMEIATGGGVDLIAEDAVSDIYGLAAKGALENLEPYFVQDKIDRGLYAASAFQNFGREDGIYGVGYEMQINTIYMKEELAGDSLEVILDNMEKYGKQAVFCSSYYYTPNKLLGYFFKMSDDFYGMVDWEEKTCSFSGELWEKILRVVKQYGVTERNQQWDEIALPVFGGRIRIFAMDDAAALREGMVLTGYPADEGMKHWLSIYGVSINAASAYKDGAWQFIRFLLEEENQKLVEKDSCLPVHEKVMQECVAEEAEQSYGDNVASSEGTAVREEQLARFWECFDNAEPAPYQTEYILDIIKEEAELYFTGDKTIEEISGIIENRVRLYLAELE